MYLEKRQREKSKKQRRTERQKKIKEGIEAEMCKRGKRDSNGKGKDDQTCVDLCIDLDNWDTERRIEGSDYYLPKILLLLTYPSDKTDCNPNIHSIQNVKRKFAERVS
jgi:hypothetical protein